MNRFYNKLASMDAYGEPVSLNFQGNTKYSTACGGLITLLVYCLSFLLIRELFIQVYEQKDPTI